MTLRQKYLCWVLLFAFADVFFARAQQKQPQESGDYRISGTVVNALTGTPLNHATISIARPQSFSPQQSMQTSADGHFEFSHLAAAKYSLTGSCRGFVTAAYDEHERYSTAIATGEGLISENLTLRLTPNAVISGTVMEDTGDPVENAKVSLYRLNHDNGIEKVQLASSAMVDDTGAYEFTGVAPGNYFVSASGHPWYAINDVDNKPAADGNSANITHSPLDLVYATNFYADTTSPDDATPIPLKGGEHLQINFAMHPMPALHVVIHTPVSEDPQRPQVSPLLSQEIFGSTDYINTNTRYLGPGETELSVAPGKYQMRLSGLGPPGEPSTTLDITSDQTLDSGTAASPTQLSGKLAQLSGEEFSPGTFISLSTLENQNISGAQVKKDGSFELAALPPGKYRLNVWSGNHHFFIAKLAASGADVEDQWIKINGSPVMVAATIYPDPSLRINGFAKKSGKPAPGVMVLLVPRDAENDPSLFRRDQSDSDGSFSLLDVLPGKYTLVAIEDGWTLNWANPNVIAHYLQHGQSVTVSEQNSPITKLTGAIEVQPK